MDTSHHNHPKNKAIDWKAVALGDRFAFVKATQGTGYTDPWFTRDLAGATAVGLPHAPYHFFDPAGDDGAAQADHFISVVRAAGYTGTKAGELPPALDVEEINGRCPAHLTTGQLRAFLDRVRAAFGRDPIVYTRANVVQECLNGHGEVFEGLPLWLARHDSGDREPAPVPGAGGWTFWQHTSKGTTPGVSGTTDRNVFRGTIAELRALATP